MRFGGNEKDTRKTAGEHGCSRQKREPVKALILNTWVTSQYLDTLTRATDISPSGIRLRAVTCAVGRMLARYGGISLAIFRLGHISFKITFKITINFKSFNKSL